VRARRATRRDVTTLQRPSSQGQFALAQQGTTRPIEERVELFLAGMGPGERVPQLGSMWVDNQPDAAAALAPPEEAETGSSRAPSGAAVQVGFATSASPSLNEASSHGLGDITPAQGRTPPTAGEGAEEMVRRQGIVLAYSRRRIPALAPRGVPDRSRHLQGNGVSHSDCLASDLRLTPGRARGRRDRRRPAHCPLGA